MDAPVAQCAECDATALLGAARGGTPKGWVYIGDKGITLCPLHRPQMPQGWQDTLRTYQRTETGGQGGDTAPPPPGAFDDED